jgi:hypothetical protein
LNGTHQLLVCTNVNLKGKTEVSHTLARIEYRENYRHTYSYAITKIHEPGSLVSILSGYGLDHWVIEVRSPAEAKGFFL